jgi:hypothetical protein
VAVALHGEYLQGSVDDPVLLLFFDIEEFTVHM